MQTTAFQAALTWFEPARAGVPSSAELRRRVSLEDRDEGFGLLEPVAGGWMLCIPDGAQAEVSVGDARVELDRVQLDPSGERRLPVCAGLRARVRMGEFRFEVTPSA